MNLLFLASSIQVMLMLLAWAPRFENHRTRGNGWPDVLMGGILVDRKDTRCAWACSPTSSTGLRETELGRLFFQRLGSNNRRRGCRALHGGH